MKLRKGNMFEHPADVLLVTTNATICTDGHLVMGRGAAEEMAKRFPGTAQMFGSLISMELEEGARYYGVITHPWRLDPMIGAFQVKKFYGDAASTSLIALSTSRLIKFATGKWADKTISLNFPGIGNGRLPRHHVLPIIKQLPDNVTIWTL